MFTLCVVVFFKPTMLSCSWYLPTGIQEFPENIKNCKVLAVVEASVNPISKYVQGSLAYLAAFDV